MYTLTDFQELQIVNKISYYSSNKLKVDQSEIESYLLQKLKNIRRNFKPEIGNPYEKFLTINLRLYSLNYLRDQGTSVNISGVSLRTWAKVSKWGNLKIASRRLGKSIEELRALQELIVASRNSHLMSIDKIDIATKSCSNLYVDFMKSLGGWTVVSKLSKEKLEKLWKEYVE